MDYTPLLERIAIALERLVDLQSQPAANGLGPNLYRELGEYRYFDWGAIKAKVINADPDGATEVEHGGLIYSRRCKNKDIWFSSKTGTEDGEPTYSRLITFKVDSEIEELPRSVKKAIAASPPPDPPNTAVSKPNVTVESIVSQPNAKKEGLNDNKMGSNSVAAPITDQSQKILQPSRAMPPADLSIDGYDRRAIDQATRATDQTPVTPADKPDPPGQYLSEQQCKRLHIVASTHHWSKMGLKIFLAEVHKIQSGSAKDIRWDQFDLIIQQLESTPPGPYNDKGEAPSRRLKAVGETLNLKPRQINQFCKQAIAEQAGGIESWQIQSESQIQSVRDKMLQIWAMTLLPDNFQTIMTSEFLALKSHGVDGQEGDLAITCEWMDQVQHLIQKAEGSAAIAEVDPADIPF